MALFRTGINYRHILFSRRSSSLIREAHLIVAVISRTIAKQEKSSGHWRNFWHTDHLYTFIKGNEVEKIIIILFFSLRERHIFFNIYQFQSKMSIQDSVFDSTFHCLLYTSEIIERQQFILAHCYLLLFESFYWYCFRRYCFLSLFLR